MSKVGVLGLGYVGQTMVGALSNLGHNVIGMDIDEEKISFLKATYSPTVYEPGLKETYQRCKSKIQFTSKYDDVTSNCETLVVTVGTPWGEGDKPDINSLNQVVAGISEGLCKGQLIVLRSTVTPGTTLRIGEEIQKTTGFRLDEDIFLSFCPERTIEGIALHELYNLPNIIGGIGPNSSKKTEVLFENLGPKSIIVKSPTHAEMCKLVDNMYRALNIGFANELGSICENAGVDSYEIVSAVNSAYSRTTVFRPGLGADGPCLSKDPLILRHFARNSGTATPIIESAIEVNRTSTIRVSKDLKEFVKINKISKPNIAFLGLAFKGMPETDDLRGAPSTSIFEDIDGDLEFISKYSPTYQFYDPIIKKFYEYDVSDDLEYVLNDANVVLFLNNHPGLMNFPFDMLRDSTKRPLLIFDSWHNVKFPEDSFDSSDSSGITFLRVGDGA